MEKYGDLPINRQYSRYNETKNEYILSISKSQYSLSTTLLLNLLNIGGQEFIVFLVYIFFIIKVLTSCSICSITYL